MVTCLTLEPEWAMVTCLTLVRARVGYGYMSYLRGWAMVTFVTLETEWAMVTCLTSCTYTNE